MFSHLKVILSFFFVVVPIQYREKGERNKQRRSEFEQGSLLPELGIKNKVTAYGTYQFNAKLKSNSSHTLLTHTHSKTYLSLRSNTLIQQHLRCSTTDIVLLIGFDRNYMLVSSLTHREAHHIYSIGNVSDFYVTLKNLIKYRNVPRRSFSQFNNNLSI